MNPIRSVSRPRRVLYVEGNVDGTVGGSFFSLLFLTSGLDRNRYQPLVVFCADNAIIPRFRAADIETRVILPRPALTLPTPVGRIAAKAGNFLRGFVLEPWTLARLLRAEGVELVHLNNSIIKNHVWMIAARLAKIPCVTHERGINPRYLARAQMLARGLAAVICISDAVRANFVERSVSGLNLVTIPNGLDPAEMHVQCSPEDVRRELGLAPDRPLVGMVGNIKPWKGQEVVIRAIALLKRQFPGIVCLLIGNTSPESADYHRRILALVEEFGLADNIIIMGYRREVADYVNAVQVLIHASILPEPFGRVLLEGMALRKPLVASRGGGVPEIVVDGVTGRLYRPGAPDHLAECLAQLLHDRAAASRMGEAGYNRLCTRFSIDRNVSATQELYDHILTGSPVRHQ